MPELPLASLSRVIRGIGSALLISASLATAGDVKQRSQATARQDFDTVRWIEKSGWGTVKCSLGMKVQSKNAGSKCSITLKFSQEFRSDYGIRTTERMDTLSNGLWAEIKLAVPIKVRGFNRPQVLVKLYRPDWLDYILYAPIGDEIVKVFSFSCRDEDAIQWIWSKGELKRFITFDRFEHRPLSLERQLKGDERWTLRKEWRFDLERQEWKAVSRKWVKFHFGEPFVSDNPVISKPSDCKFVFPK